ncbi:hypothetical protein Tco_0028171, partial [Tanacetum coccineum]
IITNSLDVGIPPRQGTSEKSARSKLDMAHDGAVANMEHKLHLLKPLS